MPGNLTGSMLFQSGHQKLKSIKQHIFLALIVTEIDFL